MSTDPSSRALSVIVPHDGAPTVKALEVLAAWSADHLLHDYVVVDAADFATGGTAARVVSRGATAESDLLEAVASGAHAVVRLLAVVVAGAEPPDTARHAAACAAVDALLQDYLAQEHQHLVRVNVVVPATTVSALPHSLLRHHWDVNAFVSPEDRASDEHNAVKVQEERWLPEHAALAVAAAGALWAGMGEGPYDARRVEAGSESPSVVMTRTFARIVLGGGLVPRVLNRLFELRASSPGIMAGAAGGVTASDQAGITRAATDALLAEAGHGAFNFVPRTPPSRDPLLPLSLMQALRLMFRFIFARLRAMPSEWFARAQEQMREGLERFVQRATFGPDSIVATTYGGLPRAADGSRAAPVDAVAAARATAQRILVDMQATSHPAAMPTLWRDLRHVAFGLLDGGELPSYVPEPNGNTARREIVTDPGLIAAVPSPQPFRPDLPRSLSSRRIASVGVRECDPAQAKMLYDWLVEQQTIAEADPDKAEDAAMIGAAVQQLGEWQRRREGTLVWTVAERPLRGLAEASASLNANLKLVEAGPGLVDTDAREAAERRLRRWWTFFALFGLALLAWGAVGRFLGSAESVEPFRTGHDHGWVLMAGGVAGALSGWWVTFFLYQRQLFQLAFRYNRELRTYVDAVHAAEHDAQQVVRLASVYEQARDWGEIIAWMVHRPEGSVPAPEQAPPTRLPRGSYAAQFAEGRTTQESESRVGAMVAQSVFTTGWLGSLYERYQRAILGKHQRARGLDPDSSPADPDSDLADPTRLPVLAGLQDGSEAGAWHRELRRGVEERLARTSPDELFPEVRLANDDGSEEVVSATTFLSGILPAPVATDLLINAWTTSARQRSANSVAESNIWAPASLRLPPPPAVHARQTRPVRSHGDAYGIQAVRVDVANAAPYEWLTVFARRGGGAAADGLPSPSGNGGGEGPIRLDGAVAADSLAEAEIY